MLTMIYANTMVIQYVTKIKRDINETLMRIENFVGTVMKKENILGPVIRIKEQSYLCHYLL